MRISRFLALALASLAPFTARAANTVLQHQGFLIGPDEVPVDTATKVIVKLWKSADSSGDADLLWDDTFDGVPFSRGRYAILLGDQTVSGRKALPSTVFAQDAFLAVTINGQELKPRLRIGLVPTAARALGLDCTGCIGEAHLADASIPAAKLKQGAGSGLDADKLDGRDSAGFAQLSPAAPQTGALDVTGDVSAGGKFKGDGSLLTNLDAGALKGAIPANLLKNLPAAELSGQLPDAALAGTFTKQLELSNANNVLNGEFGGTLRTFTSAPTSCRDGEVYWDAAGKKLAVCDGNAWRAVGASGPQLRFAPGTSAIVLTANGQNATGTIALTNVGTDPATSVDIKVTGGLNVSANGCTTLLPGGSCNVTVGITNWQAERPGLRAGALSAAAAGSPTATVAVQVNVPAFESCKEIKAANTALTGLGDYWIQPEGSGAFRVRCDMDTDNGGWTLVLALDTGERFAGGNSIWHDPSADPFLVTPAKPGKSRAYATVAGGELLIRTHAEIAEKWASFTFPSPMTLLELVGQANLSDTRDTEWTTTTPFRYTLAKKKQGTAAHACFNLDWRTTYRNYGSSDSAPDSAIFVPTFTGSARPCGGSAAHATGIGVRTDSSNGFDGYGGNYEGVAGDTGGNKAVFGDLVTLYVR